MVILDLVIHANSSFRAFRVVMKKTPVSSNVGKASANQNAGKKHQLKQKGKETAPPQDKQAIADIFSGLPKSAPSSAPPKVDKLLEEKSKETVPVNSSVRIGKKRPRGENQEIVSSSEGVEAAPMAEAAVPEDAGLYREQGPTVAMDDADFFGRGGKAKRKQGDLTLLSEADVTRYTMKGGVQAGSTPNCPFDCNCCF